MKTGISKWLVSIAVASSVAASAHASCTGKPATQPGVLSAMCTVKVGGIKRTYNLNLDSIKEDGTSDDGNNGLGIFLIEVPVPGSTLGEIYGYSIQLLNSSGICTVSPERRLSMALVYHPPFCNPPTLDGKPQQCDGPEDPNPATAGMSITPMNGATLRMDGHNSQIDVTCNGIFIAN